MENFIVSARKYRPASFKTVVGQGHITNTLKNAIASNKLAQAFLFCGPRGVGKTTCARILAKTINCQNPTEDMEACGSCPSCISFTQSASFNIHELDAASNNSVEDIRSLVDQVRIPPQDGKYKVYIIDEVHMLSSQAFNAFLKTLEEPPAYAKFILATTEKHKIIPTILSRCQIFDFKRITIDDIAQHLAYVAQSENIKADPDALHIIAQKADGALRDALSIFDQIVSFSGGDITYAQVIENLNILDYDYYFKLIDAMLQADMKSALIIINEIIDNGFDGQHFIIGLGEHLRNLLVSKDEATVQLLEVSNNIKQKYLEQARACSPQFLIQALEKHNQCDVNYRSASNKRLHLELALLQMVSLQSTPVAPPPQNTALTPPPQNTAAIQQQTHSATPTASVAAPHQNPVNTGQKKNPPIITTARPDALTGMVSIKSFHEDQALKNAAQNNHTELIEDGSAEQFSTEQLMVVWKQFTQDLQEHSPSLAVTFNAKTPVIKEKFQIEFCVDNKLQFDKMQTLRNELTNTLRAQLHNSKIRLSIRIDAEDTGNTVRPYTPVEKYNKLTDKNPELKRLHDLLELEIDF